MKRVLLALIVAVVGVFVVSSITATHLLKNSHTFRDANSESTFCEKCHPDQVEGMALTASDGNHPVTDCKICHAPGADAHAVSPAACEKCHPNRVTELQNAEEAHTNMLNQKDTTVACISCHTTHDANVSAAYTEETQWTMG